MVFTITPVNKGIANRFPNKRIEIHTKLFRKDYAPLLEEILIHEAEHTDENYTFKDFSLDMGGFQNQKLYWKFILTTPSSWWQFLPFYSSEGTVYLDPTVVFLWVWVLIVATITGIIVL